MLILAIESSCDETAAAVIRGEGNSLERLSDIVASQVATHRLYGGVVPEIASRAHAEAISGVTEQALATAGVSLAELDAVAVTDHPGLIGALLVGLNFAKSLAVSRGIPYVGVDHINGHIAAAYFEETPPAPPFLALAVSGGHTSLFHVTSYTDKTEIGATRDDAMGEAFDKVGRLLGLDYPAGAAFDRLAAEGFLRAAEKEAAPTDREAVAEAYRAFPKTAAAKRYPLPSPAQAGDALDFSFSGLKTAAVNLLHRAEQLGEEIDRALFAAAYTYTAVEGVAKQLDRALARHPGLEVALVGGVAANSHLRARLTAVCERQGVRIHIPPLSLCGDNGAMIGAAGYYAYLAGERAASDRNASAADTL